MNDRKIGVKAAILLTSTDFTVALSLLIPVMGYIAQAFPDGGTKIPLLLNLPMLLMVPSVLITGKLAEYISKKTLIMIGTIIFSLGGFSAALCNNLDTMLIMRAFMGIGAGMLFVLPQAFIAHLFDGQERVTMMGWAAAAGSFFSIIANIVAGILGTINWRYTFYCYLVYLVLIILQWRTLPNLPPERRDKSLKNTDGQPERLNYKVFIICLNMFVVFMLIGFWAMKSSIFIIGDKLGSSVNAGVASSICTIASFISSFLFGMILPKLKRYTTVFCIACLVICYSLLFATKNISMVYLAAIPMGIGSGLFGPYNMTRITMVTPKSLQTIAISLLSTCIFLGQFLGTYYGVAIDSIFGANIRTTFIVVAASLLVCLAIALVYIPATRNKPGEQIVIEPKANTPKTNAAKA